MEYNMKHMSAKKVYNEVSDITNYHEVETLFRRASHGIGKSKNMDPPVPSSSLEDVHQKINKAMNKMLDSGRDGDFTYIQGEGDTVHCQLAKEELVTCIPILNELKDKDWGSNGGNQMKNKIYNDEKSMEAIKDLIQICDEIVEKTK